jgi:hypothetical protein
MTDIHIQSHDTGQQPEGQTWDKEQLQQDFEVLGFLAPYVVVRRKSDGQKGSLEFRHSSPRIYFNFQAD